MLPVIGKRDEQRLADRRMARGFFIDANVEPAAMIPIDLQFVITNEKSANLEPFQAHREGIDDQLAIRFGSNTNQVSQQMINHPSAVGLLSAEMQRGSTGHWVVVPMPSRSLILRSRKSPSENSADEFSK